MKKIKGHWVVFFGFIIFIIIDKYIQYNRDESFKSKIVNLERKQDSIKKERDFYYKKLDSLRKESEIRKIKIDSLNKKIDSIKTKRNEIPSDVIGMDERKLDSILTNYRSPKRN